MGGKMINKPELSHLSDIIKLYFSKYSSVEFRQIKKTTKKLKQQIGKYVNLSLPPWIGGRAKELSTHTFDFVEKNKYLLSSDKDFYTYQEYHNLIKFEPALKNLSILTEQIEKVHSTELQAKNEKAFEIVGIIGVGIILFFISYADKSICSLISFGLTIFIIISLYKNKSKY